MTSPRAAKPPARFALPDDVPGLARAASLALAIARHCKVNSWAEFVERVAAQDEQTLLLLAGIEVDEADAALVHRHDHVLRLLQVKPLVTVAVCPDCEQWVLVSGAAPTKCRVTQKCPSSAKPVKASIATKAKAPAVEPTEADIDPTLDDDFDAAVQTAVEAANVRVEVAVTVG